MASANQIKGKKYEDFSKEILLLESVSFENGIHFDKVNPKKTKLERIEGISGVKHQIDIHLLSSEFPDYHLLCECKCYGGEIEKSVACAFITVIHDIEKKHPDWKIISCFLSDQGFQQGAFKILGYYDVAPLELENVSNKKIRITMSESSIRANFKVEKTVLENDTIMNGIDALKNNHLNSMFREEKVLSFFKLVDEDGNEISDIMHFVGKFRTAQRKKQPLAPDDFFYSVKTGLKFEYLEDVSYVPEYSELDPSSIVFDSSVKAVLKIANGVYYHFNKDGSVEKNYYWLWIALKDDVGKNQIDILEDRITSLVLMWLIHILH